MKNANALPLTAALLLCAAAAGATTSLLMAKPHLAEASGRIAQIPNVRVEDELLTRIEKLQSAYDELRDRLAAIELAPTPVADRAPIGDFVSTEEFAAFQEEVRGWMMKPGVQPTHIQEDQDSPELRNQVAEALEAIRKDERIEYYTKKQKEKAKDLGERVAKIAEWLELDEYQANSVRTLLTEKDQRDEELLGLWREGATDDEELGVIKRANNEYFYEALERTLTATQMETFTEKFPRPGSEEDEDRGK